MATCAGTIFQTFRLSNSFRCAHIPLAKKPTMRPVLHHPPPREQSFEENNYNACMGRLRNALLLMKCDPH